MSKSKIFLDPALDRTSIATDETISRDQLAAWYRTMRLARACDQKLAALYRQGKIVGAVYLAIGQEAICTGVVSLLERDDYFSTVARGLAGWFLRGVEPKHVIARWLGRDIDPSETIAWWTADPQVWIAESTAIRIPASSMSARRCSP